jgi:hypothetical protein
MLQMAWLVRDRNIFITRAIILGVLFGIVGVLIVLLAIPDPGNTAIQIVFLVFISFLAANTAWGVFRGKLLMQVASACRAHDRMRR